MNTEMEQGSGNGQHQQQPSTLNYGDVVLFSQNGKTCNAQVLQSQIVTVPDREAPGGIRQEEHLTLIYLIPAAGRPVMSQIQMDNAIGKAFGVQEASETNRTGWIRATVRADEGKVIDATAPPLEEYAGQHSG